ncbi:MAG: hypothetical protein ACK5PW_12510 [Burkholderiales bacterium]|jgi:hypothetical protein
MSTYAKRPARWLIPLAALAFQALVIAVVVRKGLPPAIANRDMAQIGNLHPLVGVISSLGALLWAAAAAICGLTAAVLARARAPRSEVRFFAAAACLTAYIVIDDFFMLHEVLLPTYLGMYERHAVGLVAACAMLFVATSFRRIRATRYGLFVLAVALLATSVLIDRYDAMFVAHGWDPEWRSVMEDAPKWLGIACWFAYFADAAMAALLPRADADRSPAVPVPTEVLMPAPNRSTARSGMRAHA